MEAATLAKKKNKISKGKVKKTLRNVLCRPDPIFWPEISVEHGKILESALQKHKVVIPEYKKPHWKEIKLIPKDQRQKAPQIPKVQGLIFGISEVTSAVQRKQCAVIVIESLVNPRNIVLSLIEQAVDSKIPTLCLNGLRKISLANFGIPTTCLGVKCNLLTDLKDKICELEKHYQPPENNSKDKNVTTANEIIKEDEKKSATPMTCPYLYRTSKRSRIFNPLLIEIEPKSKKAFIGQDFIEFSNKPVHKTDSKTYMNMILKKISNNQNRVKRK